MSATETAILALVARLTITEALPAPRRNIALDQYADEAEQADGSTLVSALVVADGENISAIKYLGDPVGFELVHRAEINWAAASLPGPDLDTVFDQGLEAIAGAIEADPTLGGSVTRAEIIQAPERGLEEWGAKTAKTALVFVQLTYLSTRAF